MKGKLRNVHRRVLRDLFCLKVEVGGATVYLPITLEIIDHELFIKMNSDKKLGCDDLGLEQIKVVHNFFEKNNCIVRTLHRDHASRQVADTIVLSIRKEIKEEIS